MKLNSNKVLAGREKVKVAVVQASPVFMDKKQTVKKACRLIKEAGKNGAELVVFSETIIPGYPAYYSVGYETPPHEWTDFMIALQENAVLIPGDDTEQLGKAAKSAGAYVVIGCNELDDRPGSSTVFNSLLFIDKYGGVLGRHRKIMPTYTERVYWGMGDGSDLNVYDTEIGRIGGLVCWENHIALARVAMINQGEEFHVCVWPGNWKRGTDHLLDADTSEGGGVCNLQNLIKVHAFEAGAFVLSACGYLDETDFPERWEYIRDSDHTNFSWARGGSSIVNPAGRYLVEPSFEKDAILYTECFANQIKATKAIFDSLGHYSRWDILQLQVNRTGRLDPQVHGSKTVQAINLSPDALTRISENCEIEKDKVLLLLEQINSLKN